MFAQNGVSNENDGKYETNNVPGVDGTKITSLCYNCNQHGHLSCNFTHTDRFRNNQDSGNNGVGIVKVGIQLTQNNKCLEVLFNYPSTGKGLGYHKA